VPLTTHATTQYPESGAKDVTLITEQEKP